MFRALISGGNANNGGNAGAFYANTNNTASNANANIGAHLMQLNLKKHKPCLLAKNINNEYSIGNESEDSVCALQNVKRLNNIYDKLCTLDNLKLAYQNARKGKVKSYGVLAFEKDIDGNLNKLLDDLLNLRFKTSKYSTFTINEYGKDRLISRLPFYPDRIVHHLLMLELEPIWCSIFIRDTYACIKGRGIHGGLKRLKEALKNNDTQYCLKIDVRKFYPSIDHDILKSIIRKKIKDEKLLFVLDEVIDSAEGVPIGNYLSQYFANLYLAYFDHYIKEVQGVKYYFRYADDIVILHSDKAYLHGLLVNISDYFTNELNIKLKGNYQVFPTDKRGIDFLGYVSYTTHIKLRKSIKQRMFRKINTITPENYKQKTASYNGWLKHCNSANLRLKYQSMITKRFAELGIKYEADNLLGEKIKIAKVLGKEIIVKAYKITKSKYEKSEYCLTIQIELNGEQKVIFTGSTALKSQIEQVNKDDFPFTTTIENINETYQFT